MLLQPAHYYRALISAGARYCTGVLLSFVCTVVEQKVSGFQCCTIILFCTAGDNTAVELYGLLLCFAVPLYLVLGFSGAVYVAVYSSAEQLVCLIVLTEVCITPCQMLPSLRNQTQGGDRQEGAEATSMKHFNSRENVKVIGTVSTAGAASLLLLAY